MEYSSRLHRLGLFDAKVPRYTSYPTSVQFSPTVGPAQFESWIRAIPEKSEISLYLHVPFCRRLCWFCACRTQGTQKLEPVQKYLETLKTEIRMLKDTLPAGVSIGQMHWGGGTPTLLAPDMMFELADAVHDIAPMAQNMEFSVEIDPNEIDQPRIDALAAIGLTRASIGVQDFDPDIQQAIGRIQSYDITRNAVDMIRAAGITSLNADILFGLPHQTTDRMAKSVEQLIKLDPDRVALYGYAHVPWMARRQTMIPSGALPTPQERLGLFETAKTLFKQSGYCEIGIDHFAKPKDSMTRAQKSGQLRRNFQGYTSDPVDVLIGLGASSISRFPQGYAQNAPSTSAYTKAVRAGEFTTVRGHAFGGDDILRGRIIEALMCDFRIVYDDVLSENSAEETAIRALGETAAQEFGDFVSNTQTAFEIHPAGRPLTRIIARHFDAYDVARAGHSSAI